MRVSRATTLKSLLARFRSCGRPERQFQVCHGALGWRDGECLEDTAADATLADSVNGYMDVVVTDRLPENAQEDNAEYPCIRRGLVLTLSVDGVKIVNLGI